MIPKSGNRFSDMSRLFVIVLFGLVISSCAQSTEEDRMVLSGLWKPEDGSIHTVEFKSDGEFNFRYGATLRLRWELGRKGPREFEVG